MTLMINAAERGWFPDPLLRVGIRRLLESRLDQETRGPDERLRERRRRLLEGMREGPVAVATDRANEQHYEVPPAFFRLMLGPRLKYSCCLWPRPDDVLEAAEEAMLAVTCRRAGIDDGMEVLDLGCGWGSLSLWILERFPDCRVTAVSNSAPQREAIEARARELGCASRLEVLTADVNELAVEGRFDRVVSVEMFEHMRNWERLLERTADWLAPGGRLFLHVFCHRSAAYLFEADGGNDWMARHFFTGGLMPSRDLLEHLETPYEIEEDWIVSGDHYQRTLEAWLARLDGHRDEALAVLGAETDPERARVRLNRWRLFLLACSELFGWDQGREWHVLHALLRPTARTA